MFGAIRRFFSGLLRGLWGMLKVVFSGAVELALAQIKDIAINTVTDLENTDLTNTAKREEAFKRISNYAKEGRLNVQASIINLAIELALQFVRRTINR